MTRIKFIPGKFYSVAELLKLMRLNELDLLNFINRHNISFQIIDDRMVVLGQNIYNAIQNLSCIPPDSP